MDEPAFGAFPQTRHSLLEAIRSGDSSACARGLQAIAAAYWRPVYSYLRLQFRESHEDAVDLTQEFFAELLEKDLLGRFDPKQARLRTWLRVCLKGMVANHQRRSDGKMHLDTASSFDFDSAREELESQPSPASPELEFERAWARAVFGLALERLRQRCEHEGKLQRFLVLEAYDLGGERPSYAALAGQFGIAVTDVTNHLSWSRRELRTCVLDLLRELTSSEAEMMEEARALLTPE